MHTPAAKRILVVDDAATVRLYHRNVLETEGFVVDEAYNGIEALEKALVTPYDLLLVDVNMPKLDGCGFLSELRGRDVPQPPAIVISTEAREHDRERAIAAGANFYMTKPIRPDELTLRCRTLLGLPGARA
jgi:two-component system chemotaxis response regulator CheY